MMGVVYEARDSALGRRVALKTIRLAGELPPDERERFEQRFLAEARAAAGLSHPGLVVVHDVGRDPKSGMLFIALEYLEGRTLAEELAGENRLEWKRALRIAAQLADALHHAHALGIVHRDIKPANVMMLASGQPKIMDFGIARLPASQLTSTGQLFGTPLYMSPEQAQGETVDARSDLFSLGCVLYQMLTGRRCFEAASVPAILLRVLKEDPPPPSRLVPGLPPAIDGILAKAMAKDRNRRYADGKALAKDLEDVLAGRQPHTALAAASAGDLTRVSAAAGSPRRPAERAVPVGASPPPARGRRQLVWGLVGAGILIVAALMALVLTGGGRTPALSVPGLAPPLPPGHLEVTVEHQLKSGTITVWVDDEQVLDEALEGRLTRKVMNFRQHKGSLSQTLDVAPGERVVRVAVEGDGFSSAKRIRGVFDSGTTRRLRVVVGGLIKKDLNLYWAN